MAILINIRRTSRYEGIPETAKMNRVSFHNIFLSLFSNIWGTGPCLKVGVALLNTSHRTLR